MRIYSRREIGEDPSKINFVDILINSQLSSYEMSANKPTRKIRGKTNFAADTPKSESQ